MTSGDGLVLVPALFMTLSRGDAEANAVPYLEKLSQAFGARQAGAVACRFEAAPDRFGWLIPIRQRHGPAAVRRHFESASFLPRREREMPRAWAALVLLPANSVRTRRMCSRSAVRRVRSASEDG